MVCKLGNEEKSEPFKMGGNGKQFLGAITHGLNPCINILDVIKAHACRPCGTLLDFDW